MRPLVKPWWFQITWVGPRGRRTETVVTTGTDLRSVTNRIAVAQQGRLAYSPRSPRIVRIAALSPPALDSAFETMLDAVLRLENNSVSEPLDRPSGPSPSP